MSSEAPARTAASSPVAADGESVVDLRRILGLVRPHLRPLLLATLLLLVGSGIEILTPMVAGRVVDAALLDASVDRLNRVTLALVCLFAAMGVVTFLEHYLLRATGARMLRNLRARLFDRLVYLAPDFYQTRRTGELLSRMGSDLTLVQTSLTDQIPSGLQAVVRFTGILIILLVLQTRLTLVALLVVPPIVLLAVMYGRRLERLALKERDRLADTQSLAEEVLSGIRTVQSFVREADEIRRYGGGLADLLRVQLRNAWLQGAFMGLILFASFSAFAVVLWYGGRLLLGGHLTPGELTSFLLYTFSIALSVGTLGALYGSYRQLKGASARIFELLDTRPSILDRPGAADLPAPRGHIQFERVSFAYPQSEGRVALRDIDLEIEPGAVVGLVGPSGAGKTTLFSLLLRFHDPTQGGIRLDGRDLRELRVSALRHAIGIVPQEILLFATSVEENIRYGRPGASRDDVRAAALAAGAHDFIVALPNGYAEAVGERGVKLSAGQRQRIAIARAFLKDPAILLLDEATSSLDPDSEAKVQQALAQLMKERTTLVIAHRLATARLADRILVLDGGRIAGSGTHDALYAKNEIYRRYWQLQSLRREETRSVEMEG